MNTDLPKAKRGWGIIKKGKLQQRFYESVESVVCDYNVKRANATLRQMYADGEILVPVELRPVERGGCGWLTHYDGEWIYPDCPDKTRERAWQSALNRFGLIGWWVKGTRRERFDVNAIQLLKEHGVQISRVELVALREPGPRNPALKKVRRLGPTWNQQTSRWCRKPQHHELEFVPVEADEHGGAVEEIRYRGVRIGRVFQPWPECERNPVYGFSLPGLIWNDHQYYGEHVYGWQLEWKTPNHVHRQARWILEPELIAWERQRQSPQEFHWEPVQDSITGQTLQCHGREVAYVANLINSAGKLSGEWRASCDKIHKGAGVVWRLGGGGWTKFFRSQAKAQAWCERLLQEGLSRPPLWTPKCVHKVEVWEQPEVDCFVRVTMPDKFYDGNRYVTKKECPVDLAPETGRVEGSVWLIPLGSVVDRTTDYYWELGEWNEEPLGDMTWKELRGLIYANQDMTQSARALPWGLVSADAIFVSGCTGIGWDPQDDKLWAVEEQGGKLDLVTTRTPREQRQSDRVLWSNTDPATWKDTNAEP